MTGPKEETTQSRYQRLLDQHFTLRNIHPDERTEDDRAALRDTYEEIRVIVSAPPEGYNLPAVATDLINHAGAHGWGSNVQWTPPGYDEDPYVIVLVGRRVADSDRNSHRGDRWVYKLVWRSRGCAPGRLRLAEKLANTPDSGAAVTGPAPSIEAIRKVIAQHPLKRSSADSAAGLPSAHPAEERHGDPFRSPAQGSKD